MSQKIADNILVVCPHGSAKIPEFLRGKLHPHFSEVLQRNFSDWATTWLAEGIGAISCRYGRAIGDPNRPYEESLSGGEDAFYSQFIRTKDFYGIPIWNDKFSSEILNDFDHWASEFHTIQTKPFHDEIFEALEEKLKNHPKKKILMIDLHDADNFLLKNVLGTKDDALEVISRKKEQGWEMPRAIFSNVHGKTTSKETIQKISETFNFIFKTEDVWNNKKWSGGFITKYFGGEIQNIRLEKLLKKYNHERENLEVIQIELRRNDYLDTATQTLLPSAQKYRENFQELLGKL